MIMDMRQACHNKIIRLYFFMTFFFLITGIYGINIAYSEQKSVKNNIVTMLDNFFSPSTITIKAGQKVTWINKGNHNHTVTSDNAYFNSGYLAPNASFSYTFTRPGTYKYSCTLHSFMSF